MLLFGRRSSALQPYSITLSAIASRPGETVRPFCKNAFVTLGPYLRCSPHLPPRPHDQKGLDQPVSEKQRTKRSKPGVQAVRTKGDEDDRQGHNDAARNRRITTHSGHEPC